MPDIYTEETSDAVLLDKAARGDEAAFGVLYARHAHALYRFAARLLMDASAAEDITHDCFLGLIKQPENFNSTCGALRTYLYGAARNLAMKRFRRQGSEISLDETINDIYQTDARATPLEQLLSDELSQTVQEAIAMLPPLQREALILFEYEELPLAEIAAIVGVEVGTVKARLHRARHRLRVLLQAYIPADDGALIGASEEHQHA